MKIQVSKLMGDATVNIYNKQGEMIHTEGFSGKFTGDNGTYNRVIPVSEVEYGYSQCLHYGPFEYKVIA